MSENHMILQEIRTAQQDPLAADAMIEKYMPFIRNEAGKFSASSKDDPDDALSIAMFAFYEALMSYRRTRGAFLKLAATAIRNRLIDAYRKERRHIQVLSYDDPGEGDMPLLSQLGAEDPHHARAHQEATQAELAHFAQQLSEFGISLTEVSDSCPKQGRTLAACTKIMDTARQDPALLERFLQSRRLPINDLVLRTNVDRKTMERHRKYLVAILLAYTNGFEIIRGHLRQLARKEAETE